MLISPHSMPVMFEQLLALSLCRGSEHTLRPYVLYFWPELQF